MQVGAYILLVGARTLLFRTIDPAGFLLLASCARQHRRRDSQTSRFAIFDSLGAATSCESKTLASYSSHGAIISIWRLRWSGVPSSRTSQARKWSRWDCSIGFAVTRDLRRHQ